MLERAKSVTRMCRRLGFFPMGCSPAFVTSNRSAGQFTGNQPGLWARPFLRRAVKTPFRGRPFPLAGARSG